MQNLFLSKLKKDALILDFGCGSGRDTKYFLDQGYSVEAVDGSVEMCYAASRYTGIKVRQILFQELKEQGKYDGIWACSSILHLTAAELKDVLKKMSTALKQNGIAYVSFKYGTFEGSIDDRYFTYLNEDSFNNIIKNNNYKVEKILNKEDK